MASENAGIAPDFLSDQAPGKPASATIDFADESVLHDEANNPAPSRPSPPLPGRDLRLLFHGSYPNDRGAQDLTSSGARVEPNHLSLGVLKEPGVEYTTCHLSEECILHPPSPNPPNIRTDVAVGDGQGTVAYVNEFGELVCVVQLLDLGPSGLFQAKPNSRRARNRDKDNLDGIIRGNHPGIGLRLMDGAFPRDLATCRVQFVHDQWPRFSYSSQSIDVEIQFAIVDSKVVQQCILRNNSDADVELEMGFDLGIRLESPYMKASKLVDTLEVDGGVFTTGPTGMVLAGGPGGYLQFSASLFEDGKGVPLSPRKYPRDTPLGSGNSESDEPDSEDSQSDSSGSDDSDSDSSGSDNTGSDDSDSDTEPEGGDISRRNLGGLVHILNVKIDIGQERKFTAVYQFQHGCWSPDQVHAMHLITYASFDTDQNAIKRLDKEFRDAYHKAKSRGDFVEAKKILEEGIFGDSEASREVDETQKQGSRDHRSPPSTKLFANWGGEDPSSIRLFGLEWQRSQRSNRPHRRLLRHAFRRRRPHWTGPQFGEENSARQRRRSFDREFAKLREIFRAKNAPAHIDLDSVLRSRCPGKWRASLFPKPSNFLFRRHLQHLLAVTSMPVRWNGDKNTAYFFCDGDLFDIQAPPRTNLYQFRFLLYMHRLLKRDGIADEALTASLHSRIFNVCKGHIEWCFDIAQRTKAGSWTALYRPFGTMCSKSDDPIQGAANFIKLFEFWQEFPEMRTVVLGKLTKRLEGWLTQLKSTRNEKSGLWEGGRKKVKMEWEDEQYSQRMKVPQYDLCYCIQIWEAIKAVRSIVEEANTWTSPETSSLSQELDAILAKLDFQDSFDPKALQDLILDRFCFDHTFPTHEQLKVDHAASSDPLQNKKPKERLIAITRSGKQKPRFHWHTESIILCEGYDAGFFDVTMPQPASPNSTAPARPDRLKAWKETVELQRFQHAALWKKPSRYTLALVLAMKSGISLDKNIDKAMMVRICQNVLFGSVLADGKVAEELDPITKKPRLRMRSWPRAIYGIPYYLLRTTQNIPSAHPLSSAHDADLGTPDLVRARSRNYKFEKSVRSIKKRGFYAVVNEANIFESPCEPDWLFDDPDFFTKEDRPCDEDSLGKEIKELKERIDLDSERFDSYNVFTKSIEQYESKEFTFGKDSYYEDYAAVVDVTKPKSVRPHIHCVESLCYPGELLGLLRKKREKAAVKKRLIYVYNYSPRMALAVYLGAVGLEKVFLPNFLTRHQRRGVFLRDETHVEVNSWVTELHFGFYSVFQKPPKNLEDGDEDDSSDEASVANTIFREKVKPFPGKEEWAIEKGAIGFHFIGDLNDKYWTSHVAVYLPRGNERWFADVESFELVKASGEGNKNTKHSQRKILEAQWVAKATKTIADETRRVLDYVADVSGEDDNGFYSSNKYDSFGKTFDQNKKKYVLYGDMIKFLYDVRESLGAIASTAKDWEDRHTLREVQPRWTRDDEAAYAEEILIWKRKSTTHLRIIEQMGKRIETRIEHIKQLREWLLNDLNLKEARLSNRSADDVRIFTYATVIFLPLSFASSIFSMAGPPSHSTVVSFVTAAIVALVVTIVFVLNAGTPMRVIVSYRNKIFKLPQDSFVMEHANTSWRAVPRTLDEWFVKYPAECVFTAREILTEKRSKVESKDQAVKQDLPRRKSNPDDEERRLRKAEFKRKQKRREDFRSIFLGIVLFPAFAFTYVLRFIFANTFDLLKTLFYILPQYATKRHELVEDYPKSIATESTISQSHLGKHSNKKDKEKEGEVNETVESKKQRKRRDLKNKEAKYREYRLGLFMALPRIDHVARHLEKGNTIREAIAARKEDIEETREELEKLKTAYLDSLKRLDEKDAEKKERGIKGEGSDSKSGDDGTTRVVSEDYMSYDGTSQPRATLTNVIEVTEEPPSFWTRILRSLRFGLDTQNQSDVEARGSRLRHRET